MPSGTAPARSVPSRLADSPIGIATVVIVATDWPDDVARTLRALGRTRAGRHPARGGGQRPLRAAGGGTRGPRSLDPGRPGGHGGRAGRAAGWDGRPRSTPASACGRPGGDPAGHQRGAAGRSGDAARRGPRGPGGRGRGTVRPALGGHAPVHGGAPGASTSTRSRVTRWRSVAWTTSPADRWTSTSCSTGTSTSGGASCSGTGRGCAPTTPRREAPCASLGIPVARHPHRGWASLPEMERDRVSKKNFYRVLKRFARAGPACRAGSRGRAPAASGPDLAQTAGLTIRQVVVLKAEASRIASFPRRCGTARPHLPVPGIPAGPSSPPAVEGQAEGSPRPARILRAVRRWICSVDLLVGCSGQDDTWTARPRIPIPVERLLDPWRPDPGLPEGDWWNLS